MSPNPNVALARRYLTALETGAPGEELAAFFDPRVVQTEFPNRLSPKGASRDLAALITGSERGRLAVKDQRYVIRNTVAEGAFVALEVDWSATLKVPLGQSPVGAVIRAEFAVFLEFRNGLICAQRNYDCFHEF
jgi:hypothetical protein